MITPHVPLDVGPLKTTVPITGELGSGIQPPPMATEPDGHAAFDVPTAQPPLLAPHSDVVGPWAWARFDASKLPAGPFGPRLPAGIWPGLKSTPSSEWFLTWTVPTLFAGRAVAAYAPPLSAAKSA